MTLAAVILAGGRGERLGGVLKAELRIGGITLLERVRRALPSTAHLIMAIGHHAPRASWGSAGVQQVPDQTDAFGGPLAGLAAALLALRGSEADILMTASVDTPFLPYAVFPALLATMGEGAGAIACCNGQVHPTIGAWRISALRDLPEAVVAGTAPRGLKHLAKQHDAAILDWTRDLQQDPFESINTVAELLGAQRHVGVVETPAT